LSAAAPGLKVNSMASISSMTGFARAGGAYKDAAWTWELKSVNSRSLDLRYRLPPGLDELEAKIREKFSKAFVRGAITASLNITRPERDYDVRINEMLLHQITQVAKKSNLAMPALDGLLGLKGVLEIEKEDPPAYHAGLIQAALDGLDAAIAGLKNVRQAEGAIISALFIAQLETIENAVAKAAAHPSRAPEKIKARLQEQIAPLLENDGFDPARLHQEAALLATRVDITEEIDRLKAHAKHCRDLLKEGGPVGRRLDFLAQELNREANTLCSKSHDKDLTEIGLSLKNTIDQFREQAQNIE
jgi:uncharacterized protein (TIGR00255 family)